ncbi:hypothetical protein KSD_82050 [Ktedonobacter sp. SOSP1-85]|nr:hypothetical protein KSD_82050 [Ktedonobacter sp. SOSP1-85]
MDIRRFDVRFSRRKEAEKPRRSHLGCALTILNKGMCDRIKEILKRDE